MERATTCCFTGHRPEKLPWRYEETDPRCLDLKVQLRREAETAYDEGMRHFMCGMGLGSDLYFCETVLELREGKPGITLEAVIPCEEQAARWRERDRERYFSLIQQCDHETLIQTHYDANCMYRRNRYMVDRAALLIAVYNGHLGGTMYTRAYAMKKKVRVVTLEV